MSTVPQELNWVEKRAACTITKLFNQICDGIEKDVSAINVARNLSEHHLFQADVSRDGTTMVVGQPNRSPRTRVFVVMDNDRINVNEERSNITWAAYIGLNDEGRCVLRLEDGTELEQWQFRKKALEGLFFGERP